MIGKLMLCLVLVSIPAYSYSVGKITGKVTFTGALPKTELFKCPNDQAVCGRQQSLDRLVIGRDRGVGSTLVFIKNPPSANLASLKPATIIQDHCHFTPHIVVAAKGSSIQFINNDDVLHNCHGYYYSYGSTAERITAFNLAQPIAGQKNNQELRKQGMISLECDAGHTWMTAWIWVTANPFATITNSDGEFSFDGLPPGKYTIVIWHEGWDVQSVGNDGRPIFSPPVSAEQEVEVTENGIVAANFELHK
jgi:hypothetical protein